VWELISKPNNLESFHPFCESNPVDKWPGAGAIDHVKYYNSLSYQRVFTNWIEGVGYDLRIGTVTGKKSKVSWRISQPTASTSELSISIHPHGIDKYPQFLVPIISTLYIQPMIRKYLKSVLKGLKWFLISGEPVQKNQFGTHRWFSN
jgi:hypothetical protein